MDTLPELFQQETKGKCYSHAIFPYLTLLLLQNLLLNGRI